MTMDEINKMIANYESKWGKLGHTNIMNPEKNTIHHSGINKDISQGGNKTMSRMDNELYKFRQKVAAGKEANRLAHKSYISPDELNEMNYEQLMKSRTLIHAQNPLYGQQNPNAKYYKREGQPGKYRYYYTKEEYDAAHKQGNAQTEANRAAQERQQYENDKKAANNNGPSKFNNMRADVVNEYAKIAREGSSKDAAKAFYDMAKGGNEAIDELYSTIQDGFKSGKLSYKDGRFETDDDQLREDIESFSDNIQKFAKQIGEASGKGREIQDELEKLMLPDIEDMSKKAEERKEISKKNDAGRDAAIKAGQKSEQNRQKLEEAKKNVNKEIDELHNNVNDNVYDGTDLSNALKRNLNQDKIDDLGSELGGILTEYYKVIDNNDDSDEGSKLKRKAWDEYFEKRDKIFEKYGIEFGSKEYADALKVSEEIEKEYEKKHKYDTSADARIKKNIKEKEYNNKKNGTLKQSTSGKALITNSAMGDEIMDEYSVFMEKAKRGKEMNRIAHSTFISPEDLNARYEKDLESQGILVHAGNYKYYNKIDMPNGTTRYFYTKAEWDAYQDGQGQSKKASSTGGANLKTKNASMYEDLAKKAHEKEDLEKQQKDTFEKNKAAEEAQKKAESDKWNTHKKIREDFHQVPGYMSYSSRFTDTMKETPEGSKEGKDYLFNVMYDAYKKYPKMKNIRTISSNQKDKPKDEEVFGFMDEIQKGIDKYTSDFINKYQLPKEEYTPLINNYFLSMADDLMKENALDYDYIKDVYYRNSDLGKKEAKKQEILKQSGFMDSVFPSYFSSRFEDAVNNASGLLSSDDEDRKNNYESEEYKDALYSFSQGRVAQHIKEQIEILKNRRTSDNKQQYSDEDIYNAAYTYLWKNLQKMALNDDTFNPRLWNLVPDLLAEMGYKGNYTADNNDLIIKVK